MSKGRKKTVMESIDYTFLQNFQFVGTQDETTDELFQQCSVTAQESNLFS